MDPTSAIVMLSCIYWGALFGGAITSILFNIPGEAWSVATTFDGYPMAQQGRAAEALTAAFTSSFIGSLVAVMLITFLAPMISSFALKFGPPEFFSVYLLTFCSFVGLGREGQAQDSHFDVARPSARRHRHGHRVRPVAHDLRFVGAFARRQLPGRRDRPVRHQRNPAHHGGAASALRGHAAGSRCA
jgi:ABC-type nickel/cobalt efflux system permease component RcnA